MLWFWILTALNIIGMSFKLLTGGTHFALGELGMFDPEWYLIVIQQKALPDLNTI